MKPHPVLYVAPQDMKVSRHEQPFPDSWIATTAPIALGLLTDISSEIVLPHGVEGRKLLWPCIGSEIQRWCNGDFGKKENNGIQVAWSPCEAVVRIACREVNRFCRRLGDTIPGLTEQDAVTWTNYFCTFYEDTLTQSLDIEEAIQSELLQLKVRSYTGTATNGVSSGAEVGDTNERKESHEPADAAPDVLEQQNGEE